MNVLSSVAIFRTASLWLLPLAAATTACAAPAHRPEADAPFSSGKCPAGLESDFLCGPRNAEDLLRLPDSPWVLASSLQSTLFAEGGIYLIDSRDRSWARLGVDGSEASFDRAAFPDCPGVLTSRLFSGHGMAFGERRDGNIRLFAINHGAREAVEVFDVTLSGGERPALTWVGCVPAPESAYMNSVSKAPDGGFAVTKYYDRSRPDWWDNMQAGTVEGAVYEWQPGKGWSMLAGSAMSGANGIALTADGKSYLVAEWGGNDTAIHKLPRDGGPAQVVKVPRHRPDNLHFTPDGDAMFVAQAFDTMSQFYACMGAGKLICGGAFKVMRIDPETMKVTTALDYTGDTAVYGYGTTAILVGDEIWVGTVRGDKIGIFPAK